MASNYYIGKRLSFGGDLCTVRYIGEVAGTKGEWLGIEWDDASRGKHAGKAGGKNYFECISKQPTAGSFVRPTRPADKGRGFLEALRQKYSLDSESNGGLKAPHEAESYPSGLPVRISGKEVEEVGFDKIWKQLAELGQLRIVLLDGLCVSQQAEESAIQAWESGNVTYNPGPIAEEIQRTCPRITELDLSRNLLERWHQVAFICQQLSNLKELRLDGNRFRNLFFTHQERKAFTSIFAKIRRLDLEETLLRWDEILTICQLFEGLTSLTICANQLGNLDIEQINPSLPQSLTFLDLGSNSFTSLAELGPISLLPNLKKLVINHGKISNASIPHPKAPVIRFSNSLTEVDLAFNEIGSWTFVNELPNVFPRLSALRISHNPLYQGLYAPDGRTLSADDGYMLTIARLGHLKVLNFSPVTSKDRLNAETYYLSQISQELTLSPESEAKTILSSHPRYEELCEEFGKPEVRRTTGAVQPDTLAASLVRVRFHLGDSVATRYPEIKDRIFEVEIPKRLSTYGLLGIVGKHFDLAPFKLKLFWETGEWEFVRSKAAEDVELWDSADSDGEEVDALQGKISRTVELVAGTRGFGTWVDGEDVNIRIELAS